MVAGSKLLWTGTVPAPTVEGEQAAQPAWPDLTPDSGFHLRSHGVINDDGSRTFELWEDPD